MKDNNFLIRDSFRRYLIPSILAILGGNISFMVDHIIAGRVLGSQALAAMSMVNPVFFLFTTIGTLICVGSSTMASVCLGSEDKHSANELFSISAFSILVAGALFTVAGMLLLNPIATLLSDASDLRGMVYEYCKGLIPGAVCIMAVYLPLQYFRIEGKARLGMVMFLIMAGLDIGLDLLFTLVFRWGMFGLALATSLSSMAAVCVMFPLLLNREDGFRFVSVRHSLRFFRGIAAIGSPPALNNLYSVVRTVALNALLLFSGGAVAVASFAFVNSVNALAQAFISGIAQTVSPLVGVFYGENDVLSVKRVMRLAMQVGIAIMVAFCLFVLALGKPVSILFGFTSAEQRSIAIPALLLCSTSLIGAVVNQIFTYYYLTVGRAKAANLIVFARSLLFVVLPACLLARIFGSAGVWISFTLGELLTLSSIYLGARRALRKEPERKGVLLLNQKDADEGRDLSFTVEATPADIMKHSNQIGEFCEECSLSAKQSMTMSLAIEEILLLMVEHVFPDQPSESIDVKVFVREGRITMRFRCAGKRFNPIAYYRSKVEHSDEADTGDDDGLGLQLITKVAKSVDYSTNLGLNNVIIRF
ncbi:MAG: MATE family efflux transporter [Christensenella sp.]